MTTILRIYAGPIFTVLGFALIAVFHRRGLGRRRRR
jgi:hypothetical protein